MAEPVKPRKNWIFATSNLNRKRKGRRRKCLNWFQQVISPQMQVVLLFEIRAADGASDERKKGQTKGYNKKEV